MRYLLESMASLERRVAAAASHGRASAFAYEFVRFGIKQAWACLFGAAMLALLLATHAWYPADAPLARYDLLTLCAIAIQIGMLVGGLETWEAKVILLFHATGTAMEVFNTATGSWQYPEASLLHVSGVPLFTGFMYAAVGSYVTRAWRAFDFRFEGHPPQAAAIALGAAAYLNFFTNHWLPDFRIALYVATAALLGRTWIHYRVWREHRRMPLALSQILATGFIWIAENIGTYAHAWIYPHQANGWSPVGTAKVGSWFQLMIVSYGMVASVHGIQGTDEAKDQADRHEAEPGVAASAGTA